MLMILIIVCILIWLPILYYQVARRGMLVLVIWIIIAPIMTNLASGRTNPFFMPPEDYQARLELKEKSRTSLSAMTQDVSTGEIFSAPTRFVFIGFFAIFFLNALLRRERLFSLDSTETWMAFFTLIFIANILLLSERRASSLRIALDTLIVPFLAYHVARKLVTSENRFQQLVRGLGYLAFYLIILGLIERLSYPMLFYRLQGPFKAGTIYYYVLVVPFFAVLLEIVCSRYIAQERQALPNSIRLFVVCLAPVIILFTWSRGIWVGWLVGVSVFLLLGRRLFKRSRTLGASGITLLLIAAIAICIQLFTPDTSIETRIADEQSVTWRFERWKIAIREGSQHPIFGIGVNNLPALFEREVGRYSILGSHASTHNYFLTCFAELGVVGLVTYLAIIGSFIRRGLGLYRLGLYTYDQWRGIAIIAVIVASLVPAFFADTIPRTGLMLIYLYVFLGGMTGLYSHRERAVGHNRLPLTRYQRSPDIYSTVAN
jgi:O-antigen ligase